MAKTNTSYPTVQDLPADAAPRLPLHEHIVEVATRGPSTRALVAVIGIAVLTLLFLALTGGEPATQARTWPSTDPAATSASSTAPLDVAPAAAPEPAMSGVVSRAASSVDTVTAAPSPAARPATPPRVVDSGVIPSPERAAAVVVAPPPRAESVRDEAPPRTADAARADPLPVGTTSRSSPEITISAPARQNEVGTNADAPFAAIAIREQALTPRPPPASRQPEPRPAREPRPALEPRPVPDRPAASAGGDGNPAGAAQ